MKAITIVAFLALVAIVCADRNEFAKFKKHHGRKYRDHDHEEKRYARFRHNHDRIEKHNAEKHSYTLGHNEFSDLSEEEFKQRFLPEVHIGTPRALPTTAPPPLSSYPKGPATISYMNYVLPIRNQGQCGSCWAFAASGLVETFLKRKTPTYNTYLSTQFLVDCSPNNGCNGGVGRIALEYLVNKTLVAESSYPYNATKKTCPATLPKLTQKIAGNIKVYIGTNETVLENMIGSVGPVVITMQVQPSFQLYKSGVYSDTSCNNTCGNFNHLMVIVGYGYDAACGKKYWLIRNSWGTTWGENGYARMIRGGTGLLYNNCNIACHIDYVY